MAEVVLPEHDWRDRERMHHKRVDEFCEPHRRRAQAGQAHPVWDFLFTYYSLRPRQLRVWHPGYAVTLTGAAADSYLDRSGYGLGRHGVTVTHEHLLARADTVRFIADLLRATASRPARLNCFGLHEWAMVYQAPTVRHGQVPLRLGAAGTDAVIESMPLRCSHFDAYRFFTAPARPLNLLSPTRATQSDQEQPGCLHANMDLYKWAYKLSPLVAGELVADCFALARDIRVLDMRASPYDLTGLGYAPVAVETAAGRAEYAAAQREFAERAAPLRARLLAECDALVAA